MSRRGGSLPVEIAEETGVLGAEDSAGNMSIKSIRINEAARIVSGRDEAGAIVCTGSDKIRSGFGNGDCLLLDFEHMLFAVSDGAERYSQASREILERLEGLVQSHGMPRSQGEWLERANEVFAGQRYQHKATLSIVAVGRRKDGIVLTVIHGGDSMVLVYDAAKGEFVFRTESNMNFVGRSKGISGLVEVPLDGMEHRIVISSDGISDLARMAGLDTLDYVKGLVTGHAVQEIPGAVHGSLREKIAKDKGCNFDDIGLIALGPARLAKKPIRILIGGTSPFEEAEYQRHISQRDVVDEWIDAGLILNEKRPVESCGIILL